MCICLLLAQLEMRKKPERREKLKAKVKQQPNVDYGLRKSSLFLLNLNEFLR